MPKRFSMIKLGDYNTLRVTRFSEHGAYLDGGDVGEILMPRAYVPAGLREGEAVRVFVYLDQGSRLVGTTETPLATVGQFAYLRVAWVNEYGAFLDWGLMKDLFVPFREQKMRMVVGRSYVVYIYIDRETRRIVASAKVERFLKPAPRSLRRGEHVTMLVQQKTDLGFKVIVDNRYAGMIYDDALFTTPHTGDVLEGSVLTVRPDGRLDLAVGAIGTQRFRDFAEQLLQELREAGGTLPYTDSSAPDDIAHRFGVSKKTFKRAVGTLYRENKITLGKDEITLSQ